MSVELILTAIQHHPPQTSQTEGIIRATVICWRVFGYIFGINTAHIVVSAREHHGDLSVCDFCGNFMNLCKVCNLSDMVWQITVQDQKIDLTIGFCRRYRLFHLIVRVGNTRKSAEIRADAG